MKPEEIIAGKVVYHVVHPGCIGVLTGNTLQAMFSMAEVNWGSQVEFVDVTQLREFDPNARCHRVYPNTLALERL